MADSPVIFDLRRDPGLALRLVRKIPGEAGEICQRHFPDGETYSRIDSPLIGRDVIFATDLSRPDDKVLSLLFAAKTAASLGAERIGLVAPYLPYMRQDKAFNPGEAVSARFFSEFIDPCFDWLVTVDPHLHRITDLSHLYRLHNITVSAAEPMKEWISEHVSNPLLIGPDQESHQWVSTIAQSLQAPFFVASKKRHGDRETQIDLPDISGFADRKPVIIDDIISTGTTQKNTIRAVRKANTHAPICLAVHNLMGGNADTELIHAGAGQIVSTNSVRHKSNAIDIYDVIADTVCEFISQPRKKSLRRYV